MNLNGIDSFTCFSLLEMPMIGLSYTSMEISLSPFFLFYSSPFQMGKLRGSIGGLRIILYTSVCPCGAMAASAHRFVEAPLNYEPSLDALGIQSLKRNYIHVGEERVWDGHSQENHFCRIFF